jgi:hypothetical protein
MGAGTNTSIGGAYGGGTGGTSYCYSRPVSVVSGKGAVRIIWGTGRAFPSTCTGDK